MSAALFAADAAVACTVAAVCMVRAWAPVSAQSATLYTSKAPAAAASKSRLSAVVCITLDNADAAPVP